MSDRRNVHVRLAVLLGLLPLTGCTRAPSFDILGSFFPAWLVCFISAIALTVLVRLALLRFRIEVALPLLANTSLTAFFTFALWLIFFH